MPPFTFIDVMDYIDNIRKEAYYISKDYYNSLGAESIQSNEGYLYPIVPYMQLMSSAQILENRNLYYFVFNVFMSQNKPPYRQIEDEVHLYCIAKQQYDNL